MVAVLFKFCLNKGLIQSIPATFDMLRNILRPFSPMKVICKSWALLKIRMEAEKNETTRGNHVYPFLEVVL